MIFQIPYLHVSPSWSNAHQWHQYKNVLFSSSSSDITEATQLISYLLTVALTLLVLLFACSTQLGLFW